jgi:hypothetical protein
MSEDIDDISKDYKWIDEPKYIIKIRGKTFRYSQNYIFFDDQRNTHVKLYCINGCCPKEIIITQNEINQSRFRGHAVNKLLELVEKSKEFQNHICHILDPDETFTKEFIEEVKRYNENPLNNPNLSRKKKLAYIETMDADEEFKQLFRKSVNHVESFKNE